MDALDKVKQEMAEAKTREAERERESHRAAAEESKSIMTELLESSTSLATDTFKHDLVSVLDRPSGTRSLVAAADIRAGTVLSMQKTMCALPACLVPPFDSRLPLNAEADTIRGRARVYYDNLLYGTAPAEIQKQIHATYPCGLVDSYKGLARKYSTPAKVEKRVKRWSQVEESLSVLHPAPEMPLEIGLFCSALLHFYEKCRGDSSTTTTAKGKQARLARRKNDQLAAGAAVAELSNWLGTAYPEVMRKCRLEYLASGGDSIDSNWYKSAVPVLNALLPSAMVQHIEQNKGAAFILTMAMNWVFVPVYATDRYALSRGTSTGSRTETFCGGFFVLGFLLLEGDAGVYHNLEHSCAPNVARYSVGDNHYTVALFDIQQGEVLTANWADTTKNYTPELSTVSASAVLRDSALRDAMLLHPRTGVKRIVFDSFDKATPEAVEAEIRQTCCTCDWCKHAEEVEQATRSIRDDHLGVAVVQVKSASAVVSGQPPPIPTDPLLAKFCINYQCLPDDLNTVAAEFAQTKSYLKKNWDVLAAPLDEKTPAVRFYSRFTPSTAIHWRDLYAKKVMYAKAPPVGIIENHAAWVWALCATRLALSAEISTIARIIHFPLNHAKVYLDRCLAQRRPNSHRSLDYRATVSSMAMTLADISPACWMATHSAVYEGIDSYKTLAEKRNAFVKQFGAASSSSTQPLTLPAETEKQIAEIDAALEKINTRTKYWAGVQCDVILAYFSSLVAGCGGNRVLAVEIARNTFSQAVVSKMALQQSLRQLTSALENYPNPQPAQ